MAAETVYATCTCGVLVADPVAHALFHARVADLVPLTTNAVTTRDPATGLPVAAVRGQAELAGVAIAEALQAQARVAITTDTTYLAITSPTTAQAVAQVRALTLQTRALIRLAVRVLDSIN